jgi:hypothetical protein
MPMFAYGNRAGTQGYTSQYNWGPPGKVGAASKFQASPDPFETECDVAVAQSSHTRCMQVVLGDGSVRIVAVAMDPDTWWFALTTNSGEIQGSDW